MPFLILGALVGVIFGIAGISKATAHPPKRAGAPLPPKTGYMTGMCVGRGPSLQPGDDEIALYNADVRAAHWAMQPGDENRVYPVLDPLSNAAAQLLMAIRRSLVFRDDPSAAIAAFQQTVNAVHPPQYGVPALVVDGQYGPATRDFLLRVVTAWMIQDPSGVWVYPAGIA